MSRPADRLTAGERQNLRDNKPLLDAGKAWTSKVLEGAGSGWMITEGIRQGVEASSFNKTNAGRALTAVTVAHQLRHQLDVTLEQFIKQARFDGCSWADIAAQMGTSKQAVQQKYGK